MPVEYLENETGDAKLAPSEPDQHWAEELEKRRAAAGEAVEHHTRELERHQRIGRAAHVALAELQSRPVQAEAKPY